MERVNRLLWAGSMMLRMLISLPIFILSLNIGVRHFENSVEALSLYLCFVTVGEMLWVSMAPFIGERFALFHLAARTISLTLAHEQRALTRRVESLAPGPAKEDDRERLHDLNDSISHLDDYRCPPRVATSDTDRP